MLSNYIFAYKLISIKNFKIVSSATFHKHLHVVASLIYPPKKNDTDLHVNNGNAKRGVSSRLQI